MNKTIILLIGILVLSGCSSFEYCMDTCKDINSDNFKFLHNESCETYDMILANVTACDLYNKTAVKDQCYNECRGKE